MIQTHTRRPHVHLLIGLLSVGLAVASGFAGLPTAAAQRGQDGQAPTKLWRTYPFDPSQGKNRIADPKGPRSIEGGNDRVPREVEVPSSSATTSQPTGAGSAEQQSPNTARRNSRSLPASALWALAFLGLLLLLLVTLPLARVGASVAIPLGRFGSTVGAPFRAVGRAPDRMKHAMSAAAATATLPRAALRRRRARPSRSRPPTLRRRPMRTLRSYAASGGVTLAALPRLLGGTARRFGVAIFGGAGAVFSRRNQIVVYAIATVTSAALGVAVALLLNRF